MTDIDLPVLIVDDQPAVVEALRVLLELNEIRTLSASSPEAAKTLVAQQTIGVVVQDMNFSRNATSGAEGEKLFRAIQTIRPGIPVLLITAWASLETAVQLVKEGAADYIEKPWNDDKLVATVRNLLRLRQLEIENERLKAERRASRESLAQEHDLCGLVYTSESMHEVVSLAVSVARSDAAVLISGPNGSGKEKLAEIVQANSRRRGAPFIRVNVAAIPEELAEAELFGAEAGAYTGSRSRRIGHFESADRGTLFLDEIDSLSPAIQVKLLRVLQAGEFQRLGSSHTHRADVRVISASNADLESAIASGRVREDLMYRLNVVELKVPPLADRRDDILPLAQHFLERFAGKKGSKLRLSAAARRILLGYDWPGNVRELENRLQRASVVALAPEISVADLGFEDTFAADRAPDASALDEGEQIEKETILSALARAEGIVAHAAEALGISRQALYRKMTRLGIEIERRPRP